MAQEPTTVAYVRGNGGEWVKSDLNTLRVFEPIAAYAASLELPYADSLPKDSEPLKFQFSEISSQRLEQLLMWADMRQRQGKLEQDAEPQVNLATRERQLKPLSVEEMQFIRAPSMQELLGLLRAADYAGVRSLYNYACAEVARRIAGHPPPALRHLFQLPNVLAPQNADVLRERNKFCRY